jgi:hypothetical protein
VECARRNPNWWWGIQSLDEKSGSILRRISFSNSLAMMGNKLMGDEILLPLDLCQA